MNSTFFFFLNSCKLFIRKSVKKQTWKAVNGFWKLVTNDGKNIGFLLFYFFNETKQHSFSDIDEVAYVNENLKIYSESETYWVVCLK